MAKRDRMGRPIDRRVPPSQMKQQHLAGQNRTMQNQNRSQPRQVPFDQQAPVRPRRQPDNSRRIQRTAPMENTGYSNETPPPRPPQGKRKKRNAARPKQPPRRLTHGELRRRRRRRNLLMTLLVLVFIGIGVALSVTVLFTVEKFQIENLDKSVPADTGIYTEDSILAGLGIPVGENMFQFSVKEKQQALLTGLPYLETVQIRRKLPSTLIIRVKPAVETWAAKSDSGWLTLSDGLKIMKISEEQPEHLPALTGLSIHAPVVGYPLELIGEAPAAQEDSSAVSSSDMTPEQLAQAQQEAQQQAKQAGENDLRDLKSLISYLEQYGLKEDCDQIELSDSNEIHFIYQGRAKILLGTFNNLDYKLKFASYLLKNADGKGIGATEKGTLDVSHQLEDGSLRPTWSPGDITAPAPQTDAGDNAQSDNSAAQSDSDTGTDSSDGTNPQEPPSTQEPATTAEPQQEPNAQAAQPAA